MILHTKFIDYEDVEHYYCSSDLVVLPYKKIYQSGVLMMTLSYERPALVSDLPPLIEVITDNENGFSFASENEDDLTDKIIKIILDKENLERVAIYSFSKTVFGLPTIAVPHDGKIFMGSFHSDRIGYFLEN